MPGDGTRLLRAFEYLSIFFAFARNSLIRDMTFRSNFVLDCISSLSWLLMNLGFYLIVFHHVES
ncbi:MAG: hypothetical protein MUC43_14905, partial [Pirellula sp.]|nr:hypothetical protein [Pirellula sp.]